MPWGKQTVIKFLGGQLKVRLSAPQSPDDYVKDLEGIVARSTDLSPAFTAVARYLMGSVARNFAAEGRPKSWAALAPITIADRQRKGYPAGPILVRSGRLKDSLTKPGAPGQVLRIGPRSIRYGSSVKYYRYHQYGTRNMPARKMMLLQRQDGSQISRIINTYIRTGEVTYRGPSV